MKQKVFIVLLAFAVMLVAGYGVSEAAVTGTCVNCHTMHNSQDGSPVNTTAADGVDNLLNNDCIGCHTDTAAAYVTVRVDAATAAAPAGGNFDVTRAPETQHNVSLFTWGGNAEVTFDTLVPGDNKAFGPTGATDLSCAGINGCHGTHETGQSDLEGIAGFHHGSATLAGAYRFLVVAADGTTASQQAVLGEGSSDREQAGPNDTNHNVYSADANQGISSLCGMCHGVFHETVGGPSPLWTRHPTDVTLANLGAGVAVDYDATPFGFANLADADPGAAYTATNASVVCVSCHRAHGSDENDLLRFTYATMDTGTGGNNGGCENCHVNQR